MKQDATGNILLRLTPRKHIDVMGMTKEWDNGFMLSKNEKKPTPYQRPRLAADEDGFLY